MDENNLGYGMTKAFLDKFAGDVAEKPAQTVGALWDLTFGRFHNYVDKQNVIWQKDLESFKESLINDVSEIPPENLQEPQLSLIGPAMESTRYYIQDEELRDLFVNLISKSMDDRYNKEASHSFVEVIKQLSPIDAYLLKKLNTKNLPAARFNSHFTNGTKTRLNDYFILDDFFDSKAISISLNNLERLGIISIPNGEYLTDEDLYKPFYKTDIYNELVRESSLEKIKESISFLLKAHNGDQQQLLAKAGVKQNTLDIYNKYKGIEIEKTFISLTSFGTAFYNVCVI